MKVELPYLVKDQLTAERKGMRATESFHYEGDEYFLDGPVSRRVAILDFDELTGDLLPPIKFIPPSKQRVMGRYDIANDDNPNDREFQRVSVFATVLKTIRAFESEDVLGREVTWAFNAPQLLVVPRAGKWANAFYERESHSLQFFYFDSLSNPGREIYTSLSHDIITHETGHAIFDGIAPGLYDAITPQSLALHEAIADVTSLTLSLESGVLRDTVLTQMGGRIDAPTAITAVATEFSQALGQGKMYLRSMWNDKTLDPNDRSVGWGGEPNLVSRTAPHDLSQVLSGALYRVLVFLHEQQIDQLTADIIEPEALRRARFSSSGKALATAARFFRRFVFRCLDYLPPGEISFADFGRALIAADRSANPGNDGLRKLVAKEFVRRHIAPSQESLTRIPKLIGKVFSEIDLDTLVESDWAAYQFVESHRAALGVPKLIPFRVLPRLEVKKATWRGGGKHIYEEVILKVTWERQEASTGGVVSASKRAINVGLMLSIDRGDHRVKALLETDKDRRLIGDRSALLRQLIDDELMVIGGQGADDGIGIDAHISEDVLRVKGAARCLHLATEV